MATMPDNELTCQLCNGRTERLVRFGRSNWLCPICLSKAILGDDKASSGKHARRSDGGDR